VLVLNEMVLGLAASGASTSPKTRNFTSDQTQDQRFVHLQNAFARPGIIAAFRSPQRSVERTIARQRGHLDSTLRQVAIGSDVGGAAEREKPLGSQTIKDIAGNR
jgi:hypothetical protein